MLYGVGKQVEVEVFVFFWFMEFYVDLFGNGFVFVYNRIGIYIQYDVVNLGVWGIFYIVYGS